MFRITDTMLIGDEPVVQEIAATDGIIAADQFVADYNNACCQIAGFEMIYQWLATYAGSAIFFAPVTNMSRDEH